MYPPDSYEEMMTAAYAGNGCTSCGASTHTDDNCSWEEAMDNEERLELERDNAVLARKVGRWITSKLAMRVEDFKRPDAYQMVIAPGGTEPVPIWIAALGGLLGQGKLQQCWGNMIDPSGGWPTTLESARYWDVTGVPLMTVEEAERMVEWPIYRAAFRAETGG